MGRFPKRRVTTVICWNFTMDTDLGCRIQDAVVPHDMKVEGHTKHGKTFRIPMTWKLGAKTSSHYSIYLYIWLDIHIATCLHDFVCIHCIYIYVYTGMLLSQGLLRWGNDDGCLFVRTWVFCGSTDIILLMLAREISAVNSWWISMYWNLTRFWILLI